MKVAENGISEPYIKSIDTLQIPILKSKENETNPDEMHLAIEPLCGFRKWATLKEIVGDAIASFPENKGSKSDIMKKL